MAEFIPFRFRVSLFSMEGKEEALVCRGAFSEVSGLEATMAPKTIKEGGRNWGEIQLVGNTTFAAIVLKRGVTDINDLYTWFDITTRQANYAYRMRGVIDVYDQNRAEDSEVEPLLSWQIENAMATKFKGPDLSSTSSQVAVEELQLVHEGLTLVRRTADSNGAASQGAATNG